MYFFLTVEVYFYLIPSRPVVSFLNYSQRLLKKMEKVQCKKLQIIRKQNRKKYQQPTSTAWKFTMIKNWM